MILNSRITSFMSLGDADAEWTARLKMIAEAQHFVYCSSYFCRYQWREKVFFEHLLDALSRGVQVYLIIDKFGQLLSRNLMSAQEQVQLAHTLKKLADASCHIYHYEVANRWRRLIGTGYHIKVQLSDAGAALYGSGNLMWDDVYAWREFTAQLRGDIVSVLLEELLSILPTQHVDVSTRNRHRERLQSLTRATDEGADCQYISFNPNEPPYQPNALTQFLQEKINAAQHRIDLSCIYFKPETLLLRAVIDAAQRGVQVHIYHSSKDILPSVMPWLPAMALYKTLLDNHIHVYESQRGEHSKILLIDKCCGIFGSYNFEVASNSLLAESMIYTENSAIIAQLRMHLENFFATTYEKLTYETLAQIPLSLHIQSAMIWPLRYLV